MSYSLYIEEDDLGCFISLPASLLSELNWCSGDSIICSETRVLDDQGLHTSCVLINVTLTSLTDIQRTFVTYLLCWSTYTRWTIWILILTGIILFLLTQQFFPKLFIQCSLRNKANVNPRTNPVTIPATNTCVILISFLFSESLLDTLTHRRKHE